ncbi:hypothetical protein BJ165DRAFT_1524110 [Panaeolus papilionaceus]|nr:hypothetical protein BJ165DRAFT_1524110 [Panaeolus papilionaceus]
MTLPHHTRTTVVMSSYMNFDIFPARKRLPCYILQQQCFDAPALLGSALKEEHHEVAPFTTDASITDVDMNNASEEEMKELESLIGAEDPASASGSPSAAAATSSLARSASVFPASGPVAVFGTGTSASSVDATASVVLLVPAVVSASTFPTVLSSLGASPATSAVVTASLAVAAGATDARWLRTSSTEPLQLSSSHDYWLYLVNLVFDSGHPKVGADAARLTEPWMKDLDHLPYDNLLGTYNYNICEALPFDVREGTINDPNDPRVTGFIDLHRYRPEANNSKGFDAKASSTFLSIPLKPAPINRAIDRPGYYPPPPNRLKGEGQTAHFLMTSPPTPSSDFHLKRADIRN